MPDDVRLHFKIGVAARHVLGSTYEWVDPLDGQHLAYVVALEIPYEPTLEAQLARSKRQ
jgi:hypothetical protein